MGKCTVLHIDAFSTVPGKGNPAGVVANADRLDTEAMQRIAKAVGFNETVFVTSSVSAAYTFRYFTPGHEMPLCGHATMAAAFYLCRDAGVSREFTIETQVGILPIHYDAENSVVTMRQAEPAFRPFCGTNDALAEVLGISADRLHRRLPRLYGSTGTWTLLVPVESPDDLARMRPRTVAFPDVLREMPRASVHPFALAPETAEYDFVARHFSSPFSGTVEDPVTGTASGVMGAYAMTHLFPSVESKRFIVAQDAEVGRDGRVFVDVFRKKTAMQVSVSGAAVMVGEIAVDY